MPTKISCTSCKFSEPVIFPDTVVLQCRRFPPIIYAITSDDVGTQGWPQMDAEDWCGEYEPKEDD